MPAVACPMGTCAAVVGGLEQDGRSEQLFLPTSLASQLWNRPTSGQWHETKQQCSTALPIGPARSTVASGSARTSLRARPRSRTPGGRDAWMPMFPGHVLREHSPATIAGVFFWLESRSTAGPSCSTIH